LVIAPKEDVETQHEVLCALGSDEHVAVARNFIKNLVVCHSHGFQHDFRDCTLIIGLATELPLADAIFKMRGKGFSRVELCNVGMVPEELQPYYPNTMAARRIHFSNFASLIAPFLLPEIELEIDLDDCDIEVVGIFTEKFGKSIKDVKIDAFGAPFTLKCFNLPPSLKSFDFKDGNHEWEN